jgi:hypothetical protein
MSHRFDGSLQKCYKQVYAEQAPLFVTSRVIGYKPQRLRKAKIIFAELLTKIDNKLRIIAVKQSKSCFSF